MMGVAQQAHAVVNTQTNFNPVISCNESGAGVNAPNCVITPPNVVDPPPTQTPADSSNVYNRVINQFSEDDCDESGSGDNTPDCNITTNYLIGPKTQTNTPDTTPGAQIK